MTRTIAQIDKDIDTNMRAVLAAESITAARRNKMTAYDWQALRDRNPTFDGRDHALYRERGIAQLVRDAKAVDDKRLRARYLKEIAAKYGVSVEG
jgi:hypothetical protein